MAIRITGLIAVASIAMPAPAARAEESSIDIEIGSSRRVGGRGITDEDRRAYDRAAAPDEPLTEENLPPPGAPRRIEGLHTLAERYLGGDMWKEACVKYDLLREEGGLEAIEARDRGRINAGRSYLECAKLAHIQGDFDRAEELLRISESFIGTSGRHDALRWKMLRDQMREKATHGDLDGAFTLFEELQALRASEEERIWLGEQIAAAAWDAYDDGDELRRDHLVNLGEQVAPQNVELRRLKDQMALTGNVFTQIVAYGAGAAILVGLLTLWSRWRSRARIADPALRPGRRRKNPFLDDEDETA